jgi:pimeloyl-ACP methyl ester carboxylesterase
MTCEIGLSAGTIEYEDTGGEGPPIVLLPGLLMDASLWDEVVGGQATRLTQPCGRDLHSNDRQVAAEHA